MMREIAERHRVADAFVRAADAVAPAERVRTAGLPEEGDDPEQRGRRCAVIRLGFRALAVAQAVDEKPAVNRIPMPGELLMFVARAASKGDAAGIEIRFKVEVRKEGVTSALASMLAAEPVGVQIGQLERDEQAVLANQLVV